MGRLLVSLVTAGVVLLHLAAGVTAGRVSARTLSGLPQHFLHPFINFWEVHTAPEVFPQLNGVPRLMGAATMAFLWCLGWLGHLPITVRSTTNTARIQPQYRHTLPDPGLHWPGGRPTSVRRRQQLPDGRLGRRSGFLGHRKELLDYRRGSSFRHRPAVLRRQDGRLADPPRRHGAAAHQGNPAAPLAHQYASYS